MSDLERIETLVNDYDKVPLDMSNEFEVFRKRLSQLSKNMAKRVVMLWISFW